MNGNTHTESGWITRAEEVPSGPIHSSITFELKYVEYPHLKLRMDSAPPDWLIELRRMRGRVLYDAGLRPWFRASGDSFDDPDPADLFAYHILARAEQSIVACARIVPSKSIHSGFIASALGLQEFWTVVDMVRANRAQVCEASRWVVVPEFRGALGGQIVAASGAVIRWLCIRIAFVLAATCRKQDVALIRMGARPINGLPLIASPFSNDKCRLLYFDLMYPSPWMEKRINEMTDALRLGSLDCPVHW